MLSWSSPSFFLLRPLKILCFSLSNIAQFFHHSRQRLGTSVKRRGKEIEKDSFDSFNYTVAHQFKSPYIESLLFRNSVTFGCDAHTHLWFVNQLIVMAGRENADAVYLHEFSWPPNELNFKIDDDPMFSRGHVKIEFPHFLIKHGRLEFLYASYVGAS